MKDLLSLAIYGYIFNINVNYKLVKLQDPFSIIPTRNIECCQFCHYKIEACSSVR